MMRGSSLRVGGVLVLSLSVTLAAQAQQIDRLADISPGPGSGGASYLTVYNGDLYFRANNLPQGNNCELWRYDGAAASLAAEINPSSTAGSDPSYLAVYNDKLYFAASNGVGAPKLWQFDGAGASLAPGSSSALQNPEEMAAFGGSMYFRAARFGSPSNIGIELWKCDGASQTPMDLFAGSGSSYPQHFVEYGGRLYFNANCQSGQGSELYRLNAAGTGSELAAMIYPNNGSSPESFAVLGNKLYFSAYDGVHGRELWSYDGASPALVADICLGGQYASSNPNGMTAYNGSLYFSATNGTSGYELWRLDGTNAEMVAEINPTPNPGNGDDFLMDSSPTGFTVYRGVLYFSADDGVHGRELWSYDGQNVAMVDDFYPGSQGSDPTGMMVWNDKLIFQANNGTAGAELAGLGVTQAEAVWALSVPEPATLCLLAMGAVALLHRRR